MKFLCAEDQLEPRQYFRGQYLDTPHGTATVNCKPRGAAPVTSTPTPFLASAHSTVHKKLLLPKKYHTFVVPIYIATCSNTIWSGVGSFWCPDRHETRTERASTQAGMWPERNLVFPGFQMSGCACVGGLSHIVDRNLIPIAKCNLLTHLDVPARHYSNNRKQCSGHPYYHERGVRIPTSVVDEPCSIASPCCIDIESQCKLLRWQVLSHNLRNYGDVWNLYSA